MKCFHKSQQNLKYSQWQLQYQQTKSHWNDKETNGSTWLNQENNLSMGAISSEQYLKANIDHRYQITSVYGNSIIKVN